MSPELSLRRPPTPFRLGIHWLARLFGGAAFSAIELSDTGLSVVGRRGETAHGWLSCEGTAELVPGRLWAALEFVFAGTPVLIRGLRPKQAAQLQESAATLAEEAQRSHFSSHAPQVGEAHRRLEEILSQRYARAREMGRWHQRHRELLPALLLPLLPRLLSKDQLQLVVRLRLAWEDRTAVVRQRPCESPRFDVQRYRRPS